MTRFCFFGALLWALLNFPQSVPGADWHVSPNGAKEGKGAKESPWDIASALGGEQKISAGDTLWIGGGTYKHPFENGGMGYKVRLAGQPNAPIHVRSLRGQRVTVDGGLNVLAPSTHLWIWDLEITVSAPRPGQPVPPDPSYKNVNRPWGGLNIYSGTGCKFINLIIRDNSQGVSWWAGSTESELSGCILYDNGWAGTDRGHGHAIYTQNNEGVKRISDCIFTGGFGYSLHAYGSSRADVNNYLVEGNIFYNAGPFLIGSGKPSRHIRVFTNFLFNVPMRLGYNAPHNEDCEVRGNVVANGTLAIQQYKEVIKEDNLILDKTGPRPPSPKVVLRPNPHDPQRAHVAVFSWGLQTKVPVDASIFLRRGDNYRLVDPRDVFGKPLLAGTYNGQPLAVPVQEEFAAFVLFKEPAK